MCLIQWHAWSEGDFVENMHGNQHIKPNSFNLCLTVFEDLIITVQRYFVIFSLDYIEILLQCKML